MYEKFYSHNYCIYVLEPNLRYKAWSYLKDTFICGTKFSKINDLRDFR